MLSSFLDSSSSFLAFYSSILALEKYKIPTKKRHYGLQAIHREVAAALANAYHNLAFRAAYNNYLL